MTTRREFVKRAVATGVAAAIFGPSSGQAGAASVDGLPEGQAGMAQTVLGPLAASRLGFTLAHEHIADGPDVLNRWPKAWGGRAGFVAKAVDRLKVIEAAGISTVVDLTTYDVGRDIVFLEEVSRKSGLNIIGSTGQRFFPPISRVLMPARTIEGLTEFFMNEIESGIDGTAIRAGVIKIGIMTDHLTVLEEIGLRAAARASKATGVPIRIHTDAARRAGERRAECIKLLIDAGFAEKIFLSSDSEFGGSLLPKGIRDWREEIDPPDGMLFNTGKLIPYLKKIGASGQQIHTITVENPRYFFTKDKAPAPSASPPPIVRP